MIMSNENVVSMVDSLTSGDNVAAQDAFKGALTDKIGQALDDKRQTVANDWLNAADDHEEIVAGAELTGGASVSTVGANTGVEPADTEPVDNEPFEIDDDQVEEE